jgi:hypothetical protein
MKFNSVSLSRIQENSFRDLQINTAYIMTQLPSEDKALLDSPTYLYYNTFLNTLLFFLFSKHYIEGLQVQT